MPTLEQSYRAATAGWIIVAEWLVTAALAAGCVACRPHSAVQTRATPLVRSGIYGFSGAGAPFAEPEGVVGECIWIFDERDRLQITKGECDKRAPGEFRVALKPGRYVVHGPGGKQRVNVKAGAWVKVKSVASLPLAP